MGYLWRNNLLAYGASVNYSRTEFDADSPSKSRSYNFDYWDQNNADHENLDQFYSFNMWQSFKTTSNISINANLSSKGKDDEITRGSLVSPFLRTGNGGNIDFSYRSPQLGPWKYSFGIGLERKNFYNSTCFLVKKKESNFTVNFFFLSCLARDFFSFNRKCKPFFLSSLVLVKTFFG